MWLANFFGDSSLQKESSLACLCMVTSVASWCLLYTVVIKECTAYSDPISNC